MNTSKIQNAASFLSLFATTPIPKPTGVKPDAELFKEQASTVSKIEQMELGLENPDPVVIHKGLEIYDDMLLDDSLGSTIDMKKSARLSTSPVIKAASDENRDMEIREFVEHAIERMEGQFTEILREIMCVEYGFSVTNKVLGYVDDGQFKGKYFIRAMKTKPPHGIKFKLDDFGNIQDDGIIYENPASWEIEPFNRKAFVVHTYRKRFGNPYGQSDCRRCFKPWNSKRWVDKFWDIYLERMAGGFIDVTHKTGEGTAVDHAEFDKLVKRMSVRAGMKHSDAWTVEMKEATGRGADVYERAIDHRNIRMARAVLVPDLLGFSGKPTGSYALGKKHFDVFLWVLRELGMGLAETINEQVIKPLVSMNYENVTTFPTMEWEPLSDDDKYQMMEKLFLAIEKGAITKDDGIENFVREMFKLEQREQTEDDRAGGSGPPKPPTPTERDKPDTDEIETAPGEDEPSIAQHTAGQSGRPIIQFVAPAKLRRSLTKYEQKVDFESLIRLTNESHDMFVSNWMGIIRTQHDGLLKWIRKKMIVENGDIKAVQDMKIPRVLDMRNSLQKYLLVGLYFGAIQAQHETKRGGKYSADQLRFAAFDLAKMPVTEIEKHFAKRGLELSPAIKAAAREIIRESFFITGVETEKILNQAKAVLMNGIRRGDRIWAEGELARVFDQYLQTGELVNGQLSTAHRIETIARTNFTTSINEGRRAKFTEPGVDEFVMAYQWSSVLDDATTPYCAAMDGRVLRKAELNAEGWPPAHYNCRSLVVPIVEGEEFIIDKIPGGVDRGVGFTAFQYVAEIHPSCVCHSERRN